MQTEVPSSIERLVVGTLVKSAFLRGRRRAPPEAPAHLPSRDVAFEGNTGASIAARWFPADAPQGAVVLAHPDKRLAKDWFVKSGHVDWLHERGYDVLTFDFPGYGASRGPATYYHEDVLAAARFAREWSGMLPVHVWGVSMGAFAACNAAPRLDFVRGLILESPYPSFNAWYHEGSRERRIMQTFDKLFPASSAAIQADKNIAKATNERGRIVVGLAEQDDITAPALSEAIARAAPQDRTILVRSPGKHFATWEHEGFRAAALEALAWNGS